jgi:ATP-dependent helicase HrpA
LIRPPEPILPLTQAKFERALQETRERIPGIVPKLLELLTAVLQARAQILAHRAYPRSSAPVTGGVLTDLKRLGAAPPVQPAVKPLTFLPGELEWLTPKGFLETISFERLAHWPRYLKALQVRADRAVLNPAKDAERAKLLRPYTDALQKIGARPDLTPAARAALADYRALLEEFKVSTFAQELGTAQPVSPKRLDAQLALVNTAL